MYRAIVFDFYSVWAPDRFALFIERAQRANPALTAELRELFQQYFNGMIEIQQVVDSIRYKFKTYGLACNPEELVLQERNVSEEIIHFIQYLHGHFLKVGVLADLGHQERAILENIHKQYDLFDTISSAEPGNPLLSQPTFAKALQELGEPPENCLLISGHEDYLSFATGLGLPTLRFEGFPKLIAELRAQLETAA